MPLQKNEFRIDLETGVGELDNAEAIHSQLDLILAPTESFLLSISPHFLAVSDVSTTQNSNAFTAFNFGFMPFSKRRIQPFAGFEISFPLAIDGFEGLNAIPEKQFLHYIVAPSAGLVWNDALKNAQFSFLLQPEIVTDINLPVDLRTAMQLSLFTSRKLSPSIKIVTQVPIRSITSEKLIVDAKFSIIPGIRYRFPNHFDVRIAAGISVYGDHYEMYGLKNYSGSISVGFRSRVTESSLKKARKQRMLSDSLTHPLFRDLNHGEFLPARQDRDRDGIPDLYDSCDTEKEIFNGQADFDGCPEKLLFQSEIFDNAQILKGVTFAVGAIDLNNDSKNALAKILNPLLQDSLSIVVLKCFTDNSGDYDRNIEIAGERFVAVADYLVGEGVLRERIIPEIYGPNDPVADNETKLGRDTNRRIEYSIEKQSE